VLLLGLLRLELILLVLLGIMPVQPLMDIILKMLLVKLIFQLLLIMLVLFLLLLLELMPGIKLVQLGILVLLPVILKSVNPGETVDAGNAPLGTAADGGNAGCAFYRNEAYSTAGTAGSNDATGTALGTAVMIVLNSYDAPDRDRYSSFTRIV